MKHTSSETSAVAALKARRSPLTKSVQATSIMECLFQITPRTVVKLADELVDTMRAADQLQISPRQRLALQGHIYRQRSIALQGAHILVPFDNPWSCDDTGFKDLADNGDNGSCGFAIRFVLSEDGHMHYDIVTTTLSHWWKDSERKSAATRTWSKRLINATIEKPCLKTYFLVSIKMAVPMLLTGMTRGIGWQIRQRGPNALFDYTNTRDAHITRSRRTEVEVDENAGPVS